MYVPQKQEMNRRLALATNVLREELQESFDVRLEEEKERARVIMEVEHDAEKKDLESRIRAECQEEISSILKKVGLE